MIRQRSNLRVFFVIIIVTLISSAALADQYTMLIGSKSNPNAHLFSYDQKFIERTKFQNSPMGVSASLDFSDATRLATTMDLKSAGGGSSYGCGCSGSVNVPFTEIDINADFIGIGKIDYLVLDPEVADKKKEKTRISDMYIGNFTMDEHFRVISSHMNESWFLGCV